MTRRSATVLVSLVLAGPLLSGRGEPPIELTHFLALTSAGANAKRELRAIAAQWHHSSAVMLVETLLFVPSREVKLDIIALLERKTGQRLGTDVQRWYDWIWRTAPGRHPRYAEFKARLYEAIDPRFAHYFDDDPPSTIRLDEIRWGGVVRDGIPPLDHPEMVAASEASYLADTDVVFGIDRNGDARAYPKRILAWHEMVRDRIGGEELSGVYCTLCGSMIFYRSTIGGVQHVLGTSGFLFRSNKLMYDQATESLWSTFTGEPVVGPLVGRGLVLEPLWVVTTTWGEWRRRHPATKVLSLATGHRRDYSEGAAYREYFATDKLMFAVPRLDDRLPSKAEVLALRSTKVPGQQLAIAADYLAKHPVFHTSLGPLELVVLTDATGGNRVYEAAGRRFVSWDGARSAVDSLGGRWTVTEEALTGPEGTKLQRQPAHRAFWFGWYSAYPETRLIR